MKSLSVAIQIQIPYMVAVSFESVDKSLGVTKKSVTIQWKLRAVLSCGAVYIMLYKVVLYFESVDEILKCDHSNESYWGVLSCGVVCYAV